MLQPDRNTEIPELTKLVAQAAFPKGSIFMTIRDELGVVFEDDAFADLYPSLGQPAESPAPLALVTVMQFAENLTDRQAADAVRGRIDYASLAIPGTRRSSCLTSPTRSAICIILTAIEETIVVGS